MKVLLCILIAVVSIQGFTWNKEVLENLKNLENKCAIESGLKEQELKMLIEGDFTSNDPALKKFAYCVIKGTGLTDEQGRIIKEKASVLVVESDKGMFSRIVDKCNAEYPVTDPCSGRDYLRCIKRENPNFRLI